MNYRLIITEPAEIDIAEIILYISKELHSHKAALDLLNEIDQHILGLEQMPNRYALVSDERLARLGIRFIPVKNYLIFYSVDEQAITVTITRILYRKRDWAHLLLYPNA